MHSASVNKIQIPTGEDVSDSDWVSNGIKSEVSKQAIST